MGALRNDNGRLKPLTRDEDMALVAGARPADVASSNWISSLEANPDEARVMGRIVERIGHNLKIAFPGETRERTYSNEDWVEAGYAEVARENRILGWEGR